MVDLKKFKKVDQNFEKFLKSLFSKKFCSTIFVRGRMKIIEFFYLLILKVIVLN